MKPTIEEVKKVAIECGLNDEYWYDYSEELQAFAQHYLEECMKEQIESNAKLCLSRHANGNYKYDTREDCAKPSATIQENEMTTPKEDQMRAAFEHHILNIAPINLSRCDDGDYCDMTIDARWMDWKACAESYEKKLAALKDSFAEIQHNQFTLINDYKQQISEANARNAMLVEAL